MRYNTSSGPLRDSDPPSHGLRLEPIARKAYMMQKAGEGISVQVGERGLLVSESHGFLEASLDGLVTEETTSGRKVGVLEIKCPVSNATVQDLAATRKNFSSTRRMAPFI